MIRKVRMHNLHNPIHTPHQKKKKKKIAVVPLIHVKIKEYTRYINIIK